MERSKDRHSILKATIERQSYMQGKTFKSINRFLTKTKSQKRKAGYLQKLNEKDRQPRILYSARVSIRLNGKNKKPSQIGNS